MVLQNPDRTDRMTEFKTKTKYPACLAADF